MCAPKPTERWGAGASGLSPKRRDEAKLSTCGFGACEETAGSSPKRRNHLRTAGWLIPIRLPISRCPCPRSVQRDNFFGTCFPLIALQKMFSCKGLHCRVLIVVSESTYRAHTSGGALSSRNVSLIDCPPAHQPTSESAGRTRTG